MAFHSMQHLGRREDIEGIFASVARHLAPGGRFVFDVFNPNPHCLVRDPEELLALAHYNGFSVAARYGDFRGTNTSTTAGRRRILV
ncbi:MAG: hypothetical protein Q7R35_03230 [Elusimicrobiota bacterium]|nr:hypothetical protein [Elusimicrobiota bacterium]